MNLNETAQQLQTIADATAELERAWNLTCAWEDAPEHFTCSEMDALAELLRALGLADLADRMVEGHAWADTDEEDTHHDLYNRLTGSTDEGSEESKPEPVPAANSLDWTVDLSGPERHDGERGYLYAISAPGKLLAALAVMAYHRKEYDTDDLELNAVRPGVPNGSTGDGWNDLRDVAEFPAYTDDDMRRAVVALQADTTD